jgi:hypothetical protein
MSKQMTRLQIRSILNEQYRKEIEKQIIQERKEKLLIEKKVKSIDRFCRVSERKYLKEGITNRRYINENILTDLFSAFTKGGTDATKQAIAKYLIAKVFGKEASEGLLGVIAANIIDNLTMERIQAIMAGENTCEVVSDLVLDSTLEALNEKYIISLILGPKYLESDNIIIRSLALNLQEMIANFVNDTSMIEKLKTKITEFICGMSFFNKGGFDIKGLLPGLSGEKEGVDGLDFLPTV